MPKLLQKKYYQSSNHLIIQQSLFQEKLSKKSMVCQIFTQNYNAQRQLKLQITRLQPSQLQEVIQNMKKNDMTKIVQINSLWISKLKPFMKETLEKGNWFQIKGKYGYLIECLFDEIQEILDRCVNLVTVMFPYYKKMRQLFKALIKQKPLGQKRNEILISQIISEKQNNNRVKKLEECDDKKMFLQNQKKRQLLINRINCDENQRKNQKQQNLGSSRQKTLQQVIYQRQYYQDPKYQQLFRKFERAQARKQSKSDKRQNNHNFRQNYIKQIHYQKHSPIDHLCCSQFFYYNQPIYNKSIDQFCEISVFESLKEMSQNRVRQSFISFLNENGGIILLGVGGQSSEIRVKGTKVTQTNKEQYQQKIESFLKDKISPKVTNRIDYFLEWIPVIQDPLFNKRQTLAQENDSVLSGISSKSKKQKMVRDFMQGQFVLRIKIFPSKCEMIYHQELQSVQYIYVRKDGKPVMLAGSQVRDLMQKRYLQNRNKKINHSHQYYPILQPNQGANLMEESISLKATSFANKQEIKFKFYSLLVIDKSNKSQVQKALGRQKIENIIYQAFTTYQFRLSSSTYIIQHNQRFDKIRSIVQKIKRKKNGNEFARIISTMATLEIQKRIAKDQIDNVTCWLINRFPQERLKMIQCNRKQYIITQTNIGAIFLYFLLDNYSYKTKFKKIPQQSNSQKNYYQRSYYSQNQQRQQMIYDNMSENRHQYSDYGEDYYPKYNSTNYSSSNEQQEIRKNHLTSNMKNPQKDPQKS